jgi:hypothetical protein
MVVYTIPQSIIHDIAGDRSAKEDTDKFNGPLSPVSTIDRVPLDSEEIMTYS